MRVPVISYFGKLFTQRPVAVRTGGLPAVLTGPAPVVQDESDADEAGEDFPLDAGSGAEPEPSPFRVVSPPPAGRMGAPASALAPVPRALVRPARLEIDALREDVARLTREMEVLTEQRRGAEEAEAALSDALKRTLEENALLKGKLDGMRQELDYYIHRDTAQKAELARLGEECLGLEQEQARLRGENADLKAANGLFTQAAIKQAANGLRGQVMEKPVPAKIAVKKPTKKGGAAV